ncbi:T9SS type A sorting domain-containing protein [Algibacter miyuki]|uniref:T9SS type A sorting domain-containing protein n=1 Tax=Algibacter miyuki TaxID=1306933 RepID=A0ABV5GY47_9FLAO|nr:T9SS type A sorting domain-containing protein [Algibacter miyuki]MDN3667218.1 T9SS type A sorting domain-containing protein [Algibacter miyuki]
MKKITLIIITLFFVGNTSFSQTNINVASATTISAFPHIEYDQNSNAGTLATGMNGSCSSIPCCNVLFYRVQVPAQGDLTVTMDNYTDLAGSIIAYTPDVPNPTNTSQLTYVSGQSGNFCGFRDTLTLINIAKNSVYYILFFNENQQSSLGGGNTNLNFNFEAYSPTITAPVDGTYTANQDLDFILNFDENIIVNTTSGTPELAITIGATTRQATYQSGSGSKNLIFKYTIQTNEIDSDGITIGTLNANGGTLKDELNIDVDLTINYTPDTSAILVDATLGTSTIDISKFSIYPNPTNKQVTIKSNLGGNFKLISTVGKTIKTVNVQPYEEKTIDVSHLSTGLYFIKSDNYSEKLIIKK